MKEGAGLGGTQVGGPQRMCSLSSAGMHQEMEAQSCRGHWWDSRWSAGLFGHRAGGVRWEVT